MRVRVCRLAEVPPGTMRGFAVPDLPVPVLVANVDGALYAASSMCPHEDVSLLGGNLDGRVVTCPGHAYRFDLTTGRCLHDPTLPLLRYAIDVEGDEVYVRLVPQR